MSVLLNDLHLLNDGEGHLVAVAEVEIVSPSPHSGMHAAAAVAAVDISPPTASVSGISCMS